ncbi:MAG: MurR/RpiR family transcriptional regulator [Colwelliaceae bacterium]|nr:MurR/RpiR family transcriptional regulator [Colwelliaceae bacterium]
MDIIARISQRYEHMPRAEQKIARFIQENLEYVTQIPINLLAEKSGVSHASITRLAKTLDCKNVRDLKIQLAQSAAVGERFIEDKTVDKKEISAIYQSIHDVLALNAGLITDDVIKKATQLIVNTEHCLIFGVGGGSTIMAQECHHRLFRLSVKSNAYSDPMLMRMTAATVDSKDIVICLSLSGESPDVYASAKIAQEYGAKVIAICPESQLSTLADIHLPIKTHEVDYIFKPSASRYVMMAAIDILASEVAVKNQRKSREKLRRLKFHLDEHRAGDNRSPLGD